MYTLTQDTVTTQHGAASNSTSSLIVNGEMQWETGKWRVVDRTEGLDGRIFVRGVTDDVPGFDIPEGEADLGRIERHPEVAAEIEFLKQLIQERLAPASIEFSIEHFAHQEDEDDSPVQLINLVATAPHEVDDHLCADLTLEALRRLAASRSIVVRRYLTLSIR